MAVLQSKDMGTSIASSGPYAGETRDKIFELKIKDGKDFTLGATEFGPKVKGVSYDPKTRKFTHYDAINKKVINEINYNKVFKI